MTASGGLPGGFIQLGDELILQVIADPDHRFLATARVVWTQPTGLTGVRTASGSRLW